MTPTTSRAALRGRRTHEKDNIRRRALSRLGAARRPRASQSMGAPAPMFSLLLPSYCRTNPKPTEEAMPDPDAGPSHKPGARTLGGTVLT